MQVCVSAIISKYMESKCKKRALSPESGIFMVTPKALRCSWENRKEFYSACSRLSRCSSATSFDAFVSVKTRFSRSSSLNKIDFLDLSKKSVVEVLQCEGWPFGLCRRSLLLPPLPKSPPDSWSWRKNGGMVKTHGWLIPQPSWDFIATDSTPSAIPMHSVYFTSICNMLHIVIMSVSLFN